MLVKASLPMFLLSLAESIATGVCSTLLIRAIHITVGDEGKVAIRDGRFRDVDLSEGQEKRLVLVTALLEDKPVDVFDEWVAYQDAASRGIPPSIWCNNG